VGPASTTSIERSPACASGISAHALVEDNSVRSKATTLLNFEGGYQLGKALRVNLQVYNLFDAEVSDIDYYFASRLPGEPLDGVNDIHVHPAVPRTLRVSMVVGF
jgi:outer membrane receptor protein involved in Fe transport